MALLVYSCISIKTLSLEQLSSKITMFCFNPTSRSAFSKLHASAHCLKIEKGRYLIPKIPPANRICIVCDLQKVKDEYHLCAVNSMIVTVKSCFLVSQKYLILIISRSTKLLMSSQESDIVKTAVQLLMSTACEILDLYVFLI